MITTMECTKIHSSFRWFTSSKTYFRVFNSVIERVADQVNKRITDLINDRPIQFGFSSCNLKVNLLIQITRELPDHFRKTIEYSINRNHPHIENNRLEVSCIPCNPFDSFI